jgi:low affinity Fe/Cu permease
MSVTTSHNTTGTEKLRHPKVKPDVGKGGLSEIFRRASHKTSSAVGSPVAFLAAFAVVLVWAVSGPLFSFSDTWQLVINTGTTIVTFLMVFLIQNTQNRDSRALHMKLDELILFTRGADNEMVDLETLSDEQMDRLEDHFHRLAKRLGHDEFIGEDVDEEIDEAAQAAEGRPRRPTQKASA